MFGRSLTTTHRARISVRARTNAYPAASLVCVFLACFFIYIDREYFAAVFAGLALISFPVLALSDRIVFDGRRLTRTGLIWRAFLSATGRRNRIAPRRIVHVETSTFRVFRRGTNISYLYRTTFHAPDFTFEIGSGPGYRRMIMTLLPLISDSCLDIRSAELREHFVDASQAAARARDLHIPGSEVLETSALFHRQKRWSKAATANSEEGPRADELRTVANQLRANGRLMQSLEAYRRALRLTPRDGRLIYEFARCLQSIAAARRDPRLDRMSRASFRLAERRSGSDGDLLGRLGETYFALGLWHRAETVFQKAVNLNAAGYRIFRGLGELAMRDGKIAHAINYFARSAEHAWPAPLSRWAQAETDYLRRINDDDEYMEVEVGRINLFDTFDGIRRTTFRIFLFGLLVIAGGLLVSNVTISNVGWAVSGVSMAIWLAASLMKSVFASRIPFEILDE